MHTVKKIIIPAFLLLALTTTGCTGGTIRDQEDPNKTNLHIYNYDGGVGTEWLRNAVMRFEEKYAETSFAEGKMGVKIHVTPSKSQIDSLPSSIYDMIFAEGVNIYDLINQNQLLDLTDIIAGSDLSDVSDGMENVTIESKFSEAQKISYRASDGKYYYLPHYQTYSGICYDQDVFKDNKLYIKAGGGYVDGTDATLLSVGPNGIKGDYDDGLPSSLEEFFALMDRMDLMGVIPFIWTGQYASYLNNLVAGVWAQLQGADRFGLIYGLDSQATNPPTLNNTLTINGTTKTVTEELITKANGYKTHYQEGKYYAYKFVEKILSNPKYYSDKITKVLSHLDAQEEFIVSSLENQPIAFLIEGSYWFNEAKDAFERSITDYGEAARHRRFAWMPLPSQVSGQVTEGHGRVNTMISPLFARAFINGNVKNKKDVQAVAKLFLKTLYTQAELEAFTKDTGCARGVNYEISAGTRAGLNAYARSLYDLKNASVIIDPVANNTLFTSNSSNFIFAGISNMWKINYNGTTYLLLKDCLENGATAEEAFMGGITQEEWESAYSRYF